jgi:carbamoyl-phosphate synthase large subunit
MNAITVLVTAVGGGGLGEQLLKALRLATTPYRIVAADMSANSKGLAEADHSELLPSANHPDYLDHLLRVCEKYEVQAVFCGSEAELKVLSKGREEFTRRRIFLPINPAPVLDLCLDKAKTAEFLQSRDFPVPRFRRIRSLDQLNGFEFLPAIVKPSAGGGGSANVFLAQTPAELRFFGEYLLGLYAEFIIQEYVGTPDSEYTVGVLIDLDGQLLNSIAVRRNILTSLSNRLKIPNRTGRQELGPMLAVSNGISQGEIGRFPEVTCACERIAMAVGGRGPLNIQCRLMDDRVYVFEINPRFSGTTSLRAMVGYNEPDVLVRKHILNERIEPHFPYRSGVILRGLSEALLESPPTPTNI